VAVFAAVVVAGGAAAAAFPFIRGATPVRSARVTPEEATSSERSDGGHGTMKFEPNGDVTEPKLIYKVNPRYPEEARKNKIMGDVVCRTVITAEGEVSDVEIVESEDEIFNQATIDAVSQWRFEPATLEGKPVDVYYVVTVRFNLSKDKHKSDETES
jgi:TonB family protein